MIQFSSMVSPTLFIQFTLEAGYRFISLTARVIRQESRSHLIGDANLLVCRNLQLSVFRYRHWGALGGPFRIIFPSFITNDTRSVAVISAVGSPGIALTSANLPFSCAP